MDVKEFVVETLKQITEAAQENPSTINDGSMNIEALNDIDMFSHGDGFVTYANFDIAVTVSSSKDGCAKLSVGGLGGVGGDHSVGMELVNRVKFKIPINIDNK